VIIDGEVAAVSLAEAQVAAERHYVLLLRRISGGIPGTPEWLRHINDMILRARESRE
jgi:hypothetical protein